MPRETELISGTCQDVLFSPKGGVEGLLLKRKSDVVQISMTPEVGFSLLAKAAPGKRLRLLATRDASPKTAGAGHAVYQFEALADATGESIELAAGSSMKGVVKRIHFARHGQPNGVVLESGEFIHLRPHGMAALRLAVGARVSASGELRSTVLGTRMLEARHANGYDIE